MKSIEYCMGLPYRLEITPDLDEGGFVARYPELPGCITVGDSMEEIAEYAEDAKKRVAGSRPGFGSSLILSSDYNLSELSYGQTTKQYGDQSLAIKGLPKNDSLRQTLSQDLALAV